MYVGVALFTEYNHQFWIQEEFAKVVYVMNKTPEFVYEGANYYVPTREHSILRINVFWGNGINFF